MTACRLWLSFLLLTGLMAACDRDHTDVSARTPHEGTDSLPFMATYDFGVIHSDAVTQEIEASVLLLNESETPVSVTDAVATCACTRAEVEAGVIQPGETRESCSRRLLKICRMRHCTSSMAPTMAFMYSNAPAEPMMKRSMRSQVSQRVGSTHRTGTSDPAIRVTPDECWPKHVHAQPNRSSAGPTRNRYIREIAGPSRDKTFRVCRSQSPHR